MQKKFQLGMMVVIATSVGLTMSSCSDDGGGG